MVNRLLLVARGSLLIVAGIVALAGFVAWATALMCGVGLIVVAQDWQQVV